VVFRIVKVTFLNSNVPSLRQSAVAVFDIMSFGSRGGRRLSYLTFSSSHDSEQARGGRGGYQQRDMGPPDQVLGIYHKIAFEFEFTSLFL
jgi:hypothetical protein